MGDLTNAMAQPERVFFGSWANALFKAAKATGAFAEALREAGYDPDHPASTYLPPVFLNLLEIVRRHLFPGLSPPEGHRQIGRRHLASYFDSAVGRILSKAFPLLGPERFIRGLERYANAGNNFMRVKAFKVGDRHWRVTYRHAGGVQPDLIAGGLEYALELAHAPSRKIAVVGFDSAREEFDLDVTW